MVGLFLGRSGGLVVVEWTVSSSEGFGRSSKQYTAEHDHQSCPNPKSNPTHLRARTAACTAARLSCVGSRSPWTAPWSSSRRLGRGCSCPPRSVARVVAVCAYTCVCIKESGGGVCVNVCMCISRKRWHSLIPHPPSAPPKSQVQAITITVHLSTFLRTHVRTLQLRPMRPEYAQGLARRRQKRPERERIAPQQRLRVVTDVQHL